MKSTLKGMAMAQNNYRNNSQDVALIQPPRMQMPDHVAAEYNIDPDSWRALTDAVFPSAKTVGAVVLALAYCKKHRLDIFQRPVHIVPIYSNGKMMESVWPGIGLLRIIAQRQGEFSGYDDCEFGPDITETFDGTIEKWDEGQGGRRQKVGVEKVSKQVTYPEWARFVVYKHVRGERTRLPGPKVYWLETYAQSGRNNPVPNEMWAKRPRGQIEKCAEAAALRRAFPDVLGNEYAAEEMEGRPHGDPIEGAYVEVDSEVVKGSTKAATSAKPKRSDYHHGPVATGGRQQGKTAAAEDRELERKDEKAESDTPISDNPLDLAGIPNSAADWSSFVGLLKERLATFVHIEQVDEEQNRQQFRIDAAPPAIAAEALELFTDRAAELDQQAVNALDSGDKANDGGHDEA